MGGGSSKNNESSQVPPVQQSVQPEQQKIQEAPAVVETAWEIKGIRSSISSMGQYILETGAALASKKKDIQNSEAYGCLQKYKREFDADIKEPLKEAYSKMPACLTQAKLSAIQPYNFNQRFAALNLLCMVVAVGTFRKMPSLNFVSKTLRAFRNSGAVYLGGGLMVAPEIYNPVLN